MVSLERNKKLEFCGLFGKIVEAKHNVHHMIANVVATGRDHGLPVGPMLDNYMSVGYI